MLLAVKPVQRRERLKTQAIHFKPVIPSKFPTSFVSHFLFSSVILCLSRCHRHPQPNRTSLALPTHTFTLLFPSLLPSISDSPPTPFLCHPSSMQFLSHLNACTVEFEKDICVIGVNAGQSGQSI